MKTVKGTLMGVAAAAVGITALIFAFAGLLALGVPDGTVPLFTHLSVLLGTAAGGLIGGINTKEKGILTGLLVGGGIAVIHLALTACFGDFSLGALTYPAVEIPGGILGGIWGVNLGRN